MNTQQSKLSCLFCGDRLFYRYNMSEYAIWQCRKCGTGRVWPMPKQQKLDEFYAGFCYQANLINKEIIITAASELFKDFDLRATGTLSMLDVGGGGGFFAKSFENLGYGKATYVDLDSDACVFARDKAGVTNVFNCDAADISNYPNSKFDFIYTRHLLEHLIDPCGFLEKMMNILKPGGIMVAHFPNSDSLEYLAYPKKLKKRVMCIQNTNKMSFIRTLWMLSSGSMLHGIDPVRHLWAISRKGIRCWADRKHLRISIYTAHLGNKTYSPYFKSSQNFTGKFQDFIGQNIFSLIKGGTHLVAVLSNDDK
ncbi:MAG: hypothetical protein DRP78_04555 [Candidatus Omnitrophota bacterium]|nr:MAG: hypothetical protein DRP78_04555 [Candidatus Omnitrophota bacterium]